MIIHALKAFLLFFYLGAICRLTAVDLFIADQDMNSATIYNLQWRDGDSTKTIWSRQVPLVQGARPVDGASLWKWVRNAEGTLALINFDNYRGAIFQLNSAGDLESQIIVDQRFLRPDLYGEIILLPPNKVQMRGQTGHSNEEYTINKGKLEDILGNPPPKPRFVLQIPDGFQIGATKKTAEIEDSSLGDVFENPKQVDFKMASSSKIEGQSGKLKSNETQSDKAHDSSISVSFSFFSIIVVSIMSALGLLWLLKKSRRGK